MRTTIELSDDLRARLLRLAAERGQKGFSRVVQEAVEHYLIWDEARAAARQRALGLRGRLSDKAADAVEREIADLRGRWR